MDDLKCSECGDEIEVILSDAGPGADTICIFCAGANLSDFLDGDEDEELEIRAT